MGVLPQLPAAASDLQVIVTVPKELVPYMLMIKPIAAPNEINEQWLSRVVIEKGKEWIKSYIANQIMAQATSAISNDLDNDIKTLLGEI